jgi:hypothetical protein
MAEDKTIELFEEAAVVWMSVGGPGADAIMLASHALAEGYDTPALRDLAGLPLDTSRLDGAATLELAFEQLGIPTWEPESDERRVLLLKALCRRYLRGECGDRDFCTWAYWIQGSFAPDASMIFLKYEDAFEAAANGWLEAPTSAEVTAAAQTYLALTLDEATRRAPRVE